MDAADSLEEEGSSGGGSMDEGGMPYPSDEYITIMDNLAQLHVGNLNPEQLLLCLRTVCTVVRQQDRMRQADLECVRRFFREQLHYAIERAFRDEKVYNAASEAILFDVLRQVVLIGAYMLHFRTTRAGACAPQQLLELDQDLVHLVYCLGHALDPGLPPHQSDWLLPEGAASYRMSSTTWAPRRFYEVRPEDGEDIEPEAEESPWLCALLNLFGDTRGLEAVVLLVREPYTLHLPLLAALIHLLNLVCFSCSEEVRVWFAEAVECLASHHLLSMVVSKDERLSDYGQDRGYSHLMRLMQNMGGVVTCAHGEYRAYEMLSPIQQAFVLDMVSSTAFSKLLAGARECRLMLERVRALHRSRSLRPAEARQQVQALVSWLEHHEVVKRLMRSHLHQRQYVQQVAAILLALREEGALLDSYLDALWDVAEQEGTYEGVRSNVYDLLVGLAQGLAPAQLDHLFKRFAAAGQRPLGDAAALLQLVRQLAAGDAEGAMATKVVQLLWGLTMRTDAPPDLLEPYPPLFEVVGMYASSGVADMRLNVATHCVADLMEQHAHVPVLRLLMRMLTTWPLRPKDQQDHSRAEVVSFLMQSSESPIPDAQDHQPQPPSSLAGLLVNNLVEVQARARAALASSGDGGSACGGGAEPEPPGEGVWAYWQVVGEYVAALKQLFREGCAECTPALTRQLWEALMEAPVSPCDQRSATTLFRAGLGWVSSADRAPRAFLDLDTARELLTVRLPAMGVEGFTQHTYNVLMAAFQHVNWMDGKLSRVASSEHRGPVYISLSLDLTGLPLLWSLHARCLDERISGQVGEQLVGIYHCAARDDTAPKFKAAFVREVEAALKRGIAALECDRLLGARGGALQEVQRCLSLAFTAMGSLGATMPPLPAHLASWRGPPLGVEVQAQGVQRFRVSTHGNAYVGALRAAIARQLGCLPKRVRLFCAGQEYNNDAVTLARQGVRPRSVLQAAVNGADNAFSLTPSEYRPQWERQSLVWLLSAQGNLHTLLFTLIDQPQADASALLALKLLQQLPTAPATPARLRDALAADKPAPALHAALLAAPDALHECGGGVAAAAPAPGGSGAPVQPYLLLYTLQALCALLFPAAEDAGGEGCGSDGAEEAMDDADPEGGEALGSGGAAALASPVAGASGGGAAAPAGSARASLQAAFLEPGCLEVVFEVAGQARAASSDLHFLRELSHLLVVLLHNVLDAAAARSTSVADDGGSACESAAAGWGTPVGGAGSACTASSPPSPLAGGPAGASAMEDDDNDDPSPAAVAPPLLEPRTLRLLTQQLLALALDAGSLWGLPRAAPTADGGVDAAVVREALSLLLKLVALEPALSTLLLQPPPGGAAPIVPSLLLNPHYASVRGLAADTLRRLCVAPRSEAPHLWLLQQLLQHRAAAAAAPAHCAEYYSLFEGVVASAMELDNPQAEVPLLERLLADEVAALHALPPPPPPLTPPSSDDDDDAIDDAGDGAAGGGDGGGRAGGGGGGGGAGAAYLPDAPLKGRLELVLALVRALDKRGAASSGGDGAFIRLLMHHYLFPEALLRREAQGEALDLATAAGRLEARCASDECRAAALALVAELMRRSVGALEEGVSALEALHYRPPVRAGAGGAGAPLVVGSVAGVRAPGRYCGLRNAGATCYMNSVFQQLFMQPRIRALVLGAEEVEGEEAHASVFGQLQVVFAHLALSRQLFHTPTGFWEAFKDYDGQPIDVREHQDAYEFFTRLQDLVDQHLLNSCQVRAFRAVLGGTFAQQLICRGHPYRSEREEEFYQVSVDVRGLPSLERSLEQYVQGELMEGDNAYLCEELGMRVPAVKRSCIKKLPHTLVIHLKRFEFDYHNMTRFKVRDRFEFPLELDMWRYTAEGLEAIESAAAGAAAAPKQGGDAAAPMRASSSSDGSGSVAAASAAAARPAGSSGGGGRTAGSEASGSGVHPDHVYDLAGVVVHSGSAFTGHYYSYARERARRGTDGELVPGNWLCFDDKQVRRWDVADLEQDCFGGRPSQDVDARGRPSTGRGSSGGGAGVQEADRPYSAYMLFYERRSGAALDADAAGLATPGGGGGAVATASTVAAAPAGPSSGGGDAPAADHTAAAADTDRSGAAQAPPQQQQQQQQQRQQPAFVAPYGMPLSLYKRVLLHNVDLLHRLHVWHRDYFRFVRAVVEAKCDVAPSQRKARRRDVPPGAVSGGAAALQPSVSPSQVPQQQQQQQLQSPQAAQTSEGRLAVDVGAAEAPLGAASEQLSPGPSGRRTDDADATALALTRLATHFLFQVHCRAAPSLRSADASIWTEATMQLLVPAAHAGSVRCLALCLRLVADHPEWVDTLLGHSVREVRLFVGHLLVSAVSAAAKRCALGAAAAGAPALAGAAPAELRDALLAVVDAVDAYLARAARATHVLPTAEAATVLRAFAIAGGAACAAHVAQRTGALLSAAQLLPQLPVTGGEEDRADVVELVRLLHALVSGASNLGALAAEFNGVAAPPPSAAAVPHDACYALSPEQFAELMDPGLLEVLAQPTVLVDAECAALMCRLARDNARASDALVAALRPRVAAWLPAQASASWPLHPLLQHVVAFAVLDDALAPTRLRALLDTPIGTDVRPPQGLLLAQASLLHMYHHHQADDRERRLAAVAMMVGAMLRQAPAAAEVVRRSMAQEPAGWWRVYQQLDAALAGTPPNVRALLHEAARIAAHVHEQHQAQLTAAAAAAAAQRQAAQRQAAAAAAAAPAAEVAAEQQQQQQQQGPEAGEAVLQQGQQQGDEGQGGSAEHEDSMALGEAEGEGEEEAAAEAHPTGA